MTRIPELPSYTVIYDEMKNGKQEESAEEVQQQKNDLRNQFNMSVRGDKP